MRSVNKVILIGNLTRDPNVRQTPSGQTVATFGLATNRQWVTRSNEKQGSTEFHELVAWAKLAEIAEKHLKKGKLVYVEGYLSTRSWETPEGTKKFKTEIVVQDLIMLNRRGDFNDSDAETSDSQPAETAPVMEEPTVEEVPSETADETTEESVEEAKPETTEEEAKPEVAEEPATEEPLPEEPKEEESLIDKDLGL